MRAVLGSWVVFEVMGLSTNTGAQPDFDDLRVPGFTIHYSHFVINDTQTSSDEEFLAGTNEI